jgi:hypothetical protein
MARQSTFMVVAEVRPGEEASLRRLLATLNHTPGVVNPDNPLVPFRQFPQLHFARFVILADQTLDDLAAHGTSFPDAPTLLAFLGDCDGSFEAAIDDFASRAAGGLKQIFAHCSDFDPSAPLGHWIASHNVQPAVQYANWPGRTVQQIREEAALHAALIRYLGEEGGDNAPPQVLRERLRRRVSEDGPALSRLPFPSASEKIAELLHALRGVAVVLLASPFALLALPLYLLVLRWHETRDPVIAPRPSEEHIQALSAIEDHDVTNQFSAFGNVKPGRFRLWSLIVILWVVGLTTRHFYVRGRLARVGSIHFARWVFLDGKRRLFFASNYDGSLDSYMDDFINKVAFGLNLVFSNGIGYPRTRFLVLGGAKDEQGFKRYIRRHQLPTEVWYKAYPGLTAFDLARNARIRQGLERSGLSDADVRQWLAEI